jgi:1-deoxy-D-xylulose-5-phosphate synthase
MAKEGLRPVFAVYSTFLQRAYDQILHDVCIQKLPVIFAIDRAGIVGEDGETHQGVFDLSYLSHIPNMTILAPKCIGELRSMMNWALEQSYPIAIRYPRGGEHASVDLKPIEKLQHGRWETLCQGGKTTIIATGKMVEAVVLAKEKLGKLGIEITIVNACFIKPIDKSLLNELVSAGQNIVTIEDNVVHGGLGSLVLEYISTLGKNTRVLNLGFKDEFITHGSVEMLYKLYGLDVDGIVQSIIALEG